MSEEDFLVYQRTFHLKNEKIYDPDEKSTESEFVIEKHFNFLSNLFHNKSISELKTLIINKYKNLTCVPFYSVGKNTTEYLPMELIFLTTGSMVCVQVISLKKL